MTIETNTCQMKFDQLLDKTVVIIWTSWIRCQVHTLWNIVDRGLSHTCGWDHANWSIHDIYGNLAHTSLDGCTKLCCGPLWFKCCLHCRCISSIYLIYMNVAEIDPFLETTNHRSLKPNIILLIVFVWKSWALLHF